MLGRAPRSARSARFTRLNRLLAPATAAAVVAGTVVAVQQLPSPPTRPVAASAPHSTAIWESALQGRRGLSPDVTVRQLARASVAAHTLRVRFSNPFGESAVGIREAWLGLPVASGLATLIPGSNHQITFHGRRTVSIQPGDSVLSDPVAVDVDAEQDVAVSVYAPGAPVNDHAFPPFSGDPPAMFIGTGGNTAATESAKSFPSTPVITGAQTSDATGYHPGQLWWLDLLVGERADAAGTLVTLGDSITDGYRAEGPPGQRWTDVLADRLQALPESRRLAVANAGISGNTVSVQPNPYDPTGQCCGPPAPERLNRDVLAVPGVRTVFLLEGTNDLGGGDNAPPADAEQVISAMTGIAQRLHARGLRVVAATVLPMCNTVGSTKEAARLAVNRWIRNTKAFDAVVDFDAVLRDPKDPTTMIADLKYDCYHPNAAGDALLGAAIPLSVLTG
ncbi:MAG TPA: GDSL-type esterase/lipase family protein [Kineosporiaceae bacterium]|nr:GDSL-type esterase/lipase family protein [Kineosporiaceae bacterium]